MPTIPKKYRDMAMKIICDNSSSDKECYMTSKALTHRGFPNDVNVDEVIDVLRSMGYLDILHMPATGEPYIHLTGKGRCYFEQQADDAAATRKKYLHDWGIAIFTAVAGAFLSRPLWNILDSVISFLSSLLMTP